MDFEEYLGQQIDERMEVYEEIKDQVYNEALLDFYNELDKCVTELELIKNNITYESVNDALSQTYEKLKRR